MEVAEPKQLKNFEALQKLGILKRRNIYLTYIKSVQLVEYTTM